MRSFTQNTIRKILAAGEDYQDRIALFDMLIASEDNRNMIVSMLVAPPEKVEVPVEKIKVVFATDEYYPKQAYRFIHNGGEVRRLIDCIRTVRMATKIGLKEAKDLVEGLPFIGYPTLFERAVMDEILACGFVIEKLR